MCTNPIRIKNKRLKALSVEVPTSYINVPCGQCDECLQHRANDLYVRARMEYECCLRSGGCGFMCCLTYSNDLLPYLIHDGKKYMVFNKKDVILFIKRLRINLDRFFQLHFNNNAPDFKYLVTSEFGVDPERTKRPHYHALFFFRHPISYFAFRTCFVKSLCKRVGKKNVRCFGKIFQCDLLDPTRGGVKYSCKYVLKDVMYEPQRKAISDLIKFKRNYVNSMFDIIAYPHNAEEEFKNTCIRRTKEYRKKVADLVLPYRHMLQFYMLSNDLGCSYIIQRYGECLYTSPVVNFDGFPYSLPKNVRKKLEHDFGVQAIEKLQKSQFMTYVTKTLTNLCNDFEIRPDEKADLIAFANEYIQPFGGAFYLVRNTDLTISQKLFNMSRFDNLSLEFQVYDDNDFFGMRDRLFYLLAMDNSKDKLVIRARLAKQRKEKQKSDYEKKKRNNSLKFG